MFTATDLDNMKLETFFFGGGGGGGYDFIRMDRHTNELKKAWQEGQAEGEKLFGPGLFVCRKYLWFDA